jgi:hypothetical protein
VRKKRWLGSAAAAACVAVAAFAAWPRGTDDFAAIRRFHPDESWKTMAIPPGLRLHTFSFRGEPREIGKMLGVEGPWMLMNGKRYGYGCRVKLKSGLVGLFQTAGYEGYTCSLIVGN